MRVALLAIGLACFLAACGGDDPNSQSAEENCIILANGNKLCGEDAKAYCERFAQDSGDVETARACISVGADPSSEAEDRRREEEDQEEREAAENRKKVRGGDDFVPAVKHVIGEDLIVVRVETPGDVIVETFYSREEDPISDTAIPAPSRAKLQKVCSAVHGVDPSVTVTVVEDDGQTPLETCPPER
jgi:hypothetical protein